MYALNNIMSTKLCGKTSAEHIYEIIKVKIEEPIKT